MRRGRGYPPPVEQPPEPEPVDRALPIVWTLAWVGLFLLLLLDSRTWGPPIRGSCWGAIETFALAVVALLRDPLGLVGVVVALGFGALTRANTHVERVLLRAWWALGALIPCAFAVAEVGVFHPGAWGSWGRDPTKAYALFLAGVALALLLDLAWMWRLRSIAPPNPALSLRELLPTVALAGPPLAATALAVRFEASLPRTELLAVSTPLATTITAFGLSIGLRLLLRPRPGAPDTLSA